MIEITNPNNCAGCYACYNVCPKHSIELVADSEGFRYPIVDEKRCINCHLCEQVCPYINLSVKGDTLKKPEIFTIRSKREKVLDHSASGGVFYELACEVIRHGGVVFGVVWGDRYDIVYHKSARTIDELSDMQGSKYVQSDVKYCYKEAKELLNKGTMVCFSGTPCQIAALFTFLQKDYDNLITCDLICHGVPSPIVLQKYLEEIEKDKGKRIVGYYRDKLSGWAPASYTAVFEDGTILSGMKNNAYSKLFTYYNAQQRKSCYACRFSRSPRIADISLGDYFVQKNAIDIKGNEVIAKDNKGLSLITINTQQGETWFKKILPYVQYDKLQPYSVTSWHLFQGPGNASNISERNKLFKYLRLGFGFSKTYDALFNKHSRLYALYMNVYCILKSTFMKGR